MTCTVMLVVSCVSLGLSFYSMHRAKKMRDWNNRLMEVNDELQVRLTLIQQVRRAQGW